MTIPTSAAMILACLLGHQTLSTAALGTLADGKTDAGPALQRALDSARPGDILVLPAGRYLVGRSLVLRRDGVTLAGDHATLAATNPDQQTMAITGNHDVLFGITFIGTGGQRLGSNSSTKIEVSGSDDLIENNSITGGASAGIFVTGAMRFAIIGNSVAGTLADGIHMTNGAHGGIVSGNRVAGNGDDMIAVVSYAAQKQPDSDILIKGNTVSGNYWGRGISVVGGRNVTISGNRIADVQQSAAIYLAEEEGRYHTASVANVLVQNNTITNTETQNSFIPPAGHAAIYLFTWKGSVRGVLFKGNIVDGAGFGGFEANGNICDVTSQNNKFRNTGRPRINLGLRNCAFSIFNHCTTSNIDGLKKCPGNAAPVTGANISNNAGDSWNCDPGLFRP